MKEKLENIYQFLNENRSYNQKIQEKYFSSWVCPHQDTADKIISMLYNVSSSQSRPNIDQLSDFFRYIYANKKSLDSFQSFTNYLGGTSGAEANYKMLFNNLKSHKGWGVKTSALFVKNIYHMHSENYPEKLKIWNDVPQKFAENDTLFLPVDSVIEKIFEKIVETPQLGRAKKWSFSNINLTLKKYYESEQIAIWDDLWFWGFITQRSLSGGERDLEWNENKYWMLEESNKESEEISKIKEKSEEFLAILRI